MTIDQSNRWTNIENFNSNDVSWRNVYFFVQHWKTQINFFDKPIYSRWNHEIFLFTYCDACDCSTMNLAMIFLSFVLCINISIIVSNSKVVNVNCMQCTDSTLMFNNKLQFLSNLFWFFQHFSVLCFQICSLLEQVFLLYFLNFHIVIQPFSNHASAPFYYFSIASCWPNIIFIILRQNGYEISMYVTTVHDIFPNQKDNFTIIASAHDFIFIDRKNTLNIFINFDVLNVNWNFLFFFDCFVFQMIVVTVKVSVKSNLFFCFWVLFGGSFEFFFAKLFSTISFKHHQQLLEAGSLLFLCF